MKILLIEPFYEGSHAHWAKGYWRNSRHEIQLLTLPGRYWKWRMHGAAVTLAEQFMESDFEPDLVLATDMLDVATFQALTRKRLYNTRFAVYFHENQITYPWSPTDDDVKLKRNNQYGFLNYTSALCSDVVFFNSTFHQQSFLRALPEFLEQFPDFNNLHTIETITQKSSVLNLGLDLKRFNGIEVKKPKEAVLLWNHRWEYDKNPDEFFKVLLRIKSEGISFKVIVIGKSYPRVPPIFAEAKETLTAEILHWGFVESFEEYAQLLHLADILPVTSQQDFFGGSVVEAIYCNCHPILPYRLAYPEHIPSALHDVHLYHDIKGIYPKLKAAIQDIATIRANRTYSGFVQKYDWKVLTEVYDRAMVMVGK